MMHSNKDWKYVDTKKHPEEIGEIWPDTDDIPEDEDLIIESIINLSSAQVLSDKSGDLDSIKVLSPDKEVQESTKRKRNTVSVDEAWELGFIHKHVNVDNVEEQWLHGHLNCDTCICGSTEIVVSTPIDNYMRLYRETNIWFDHGFIVGFGAALIHRYHRDDVEIIHVLYSGTKIVKKRWFHYVPP